MTDTIHLTHAATLAAVERCVLWHLPAEEALGLGPLCRVFPRDGFLLVCFGPPDDIDRHRQVFWIGFAAALWSPPEPLQLHHYGRPLSNSEAARFTACIGGRRNR